MSIGIGPMAVVAATVAVTSDGAAPSQPNKIEEIWMPTAELRWWRKSFWEKYVLEQKFLLKGSNRAQWRAVEYVTGE